MAQARPDTDYNTVHPHFALRMRSPAEFIQAQTATA